jgi:hypothetical protein
MGGILLLVTLVDSEGSSLFDFTMDCNANLLAILSAALSPTLFLCWPPLNSEDPQSEKDFA